MSAGGMVWARLLMLHVVTATVVGCYREDVGGVEPYGPFVRIELADGDVDPEGEAVISEQDATSTTPAYAFLDVDDSEHERDGVGWVLQAAIPLDALAYGEEVEIVLPLASAGGVGSRHQLPSVGNATIVRSITHGEVAEEGTSGSVTIQLDLCRGLIEGDVEAEPASLSATFLGAIVVDEKLSDRCP